MNSTTVELLVPVITDRAWRSPRKVAADVPWDSTLADDGLAVASVQVRPLDDVVLCVHPVHAAAGVVDGEAVGPEEVRVGDDPPVGAVHVGVLDARRVAPVRPVDLTGEDSGTVGVSLLSAFETLRKRRQKSPLSPYDSSVMPAGRRGRDGGGFHIFQLSHANEHRNKLNEFSNFSQGLHLKNLKMML